MTDKIVSTWPLIALRGILALGLALICLEKTPALPAYRADLFGAYILVDGALCGLIVAAVRGRRGSALLVLASAFCIGAALLSAPHVPAPYLAMGLAAWGLAVSLVALNGGYALYRDTPGPRRVIELGCGVRTRRGATTESGMLLAGVVGLTFAVVVLALTAGRIAISPGLIGLFAAVFGFLNLRTGLTLGLFTLCQANAGRRTPAQGDMADSAEWSV
jgi:hypothetical protein